MLCQAIHGGHAHAIIFIAVDILLLEIVVIGVERVALLQFLVIAKWRQILN